MIIQSSTTVIKTKSGGERFRRLFEQVDEKKFVTWERIDDQENVIESWDVDVTDTVPLDTGRKLEQIYAIVVRDGRYR